MNNFNKIEGFTPSTAVILGSESTTTWPQTQQTKTEVLINNEFTVLFSSLRSSNGAPVYFNETCVFLDNHDSEVIGTADLNIHKFLEEAGYTVTYGLDNTTQGEIE